MTDATKNAFAVAFAKAQSEMKNAVFNKVNPHFNSKYADLGAVREATIDALTSNGFSLSQTTLLRDDGSTMLKTELLHDSGEARFSYALITGTTEQQQGSSRTYKRRYCWAEICGIASEEDDDANEAERERPTPKTKKKTREEGNYEALVSLLGETTTQKEVDAFIGSYRTQIDELPTDWKNTFREDCRRHRAGLSE